MSLTFGSRRALLSRDKGGGVPNGALTLRGRALTLRAKTLTLGAASA